MFETRVNERRDETPVADSDVAMRHQEEEDGTADAEALVYRPPRRLRGGAEVRGQSAVSLCVLPDPSHGECLVRIHGLFESAEESDRWNRNVGSREVIDHDLFTAPTCEWLYPNGETTASTHYRNAELQRIMDAAERNPKAVQDYKAWKSAQDAEEAKRAEEEAKRAETLDAEDAPERQFSEDA